MTKTIKEIIEREVLDNNFPKKIPKGITHKERQELISSAYIIESEDGKNIIVSGGYTVFLYISYIDKGRENMLKRILKHKNWRQYKEFLIVTKREKLFKIIGELENPNSINISNVILKHKKGEQK